MYSSGGSEEHKVEADPTTANHFNHLKGFDPDSTLSRADFGYAIHLQLNAEYTVYVLLTVGYNQTCFVDPAAVPFNIQYCMLS